ncbi:bilirubin reductase, long form [Clostridium perfringens]|uniref:bilirubin reductase, long form n=1 Tax=Clostridium perfringens TaxID=1502 RepID=UPI001A307F74|nr:bilirubin reductase, long form [Clostridium perfringens]HAT4106550.1 FAD-dependent oxidoreductase [Clostridium perfringens]HAT4358721.1 FAD-dependent oxidoreductase [Clostridium perfringens]
MKLLEKINIGKITLKNRVMFPPLTTGYEGRDGSITQQCIDFYERLAEGGVGYIVIGDVAPINSFSPTPKLFDDKQIDGFKKLSDSIHKYGAKVAVQIFHPEYDCDAINKMFATGDFDGVRKKLHHDMQHFVNEISEEGLKEIINKMCNCAIRAEKAGVDIIQIHGDRLVGSLCSTILNKRTDKYGGTLENRTRFALEFVRALKKAVPNMTIDYKFSVVTPERGKGGVNLDEAPIFAKWLEEAGVDMLHVAQANHTGNMADTIPPMGVQPYGFFVDIATQIKKSVNIPVSTVGRIFNPKMAESILESDKADIIGIGRILLADADWVNKIIENRQEDIRECICCNKGCTDNIQNRKFLSCILNAENGYEGTRKINKSESKKKVVVVGGGPAGLEAARVASLKGHDVTLFEESTSLGGQLNLACIPPRKNEMRRAIRFLTHSVVSQNVDLRLGKKVTQEDILSLNPDVVLVAVGASNFIPHIDGYDKQIVCDSWKILSGEQQVFGNIAVIGGGMVGCEVAEYLCLEEGNKVSIVEMDNNIAKGESSTILPTMMGNFSKNNVKIYTNHKVNKIDKDCIICENDSKEIKIPCDYVVMAVGAKPNSFEINKLLENNIKVVKIGDCKDRASDIENAIKTAYDAANEI